MERRTTGQSFLDALAMARAEGSLRWVVATRNAKKLRELREVLESMGVALETLEAYPHAPEVDETGSTFEENAALKAVTVARALDRWVLADDSGLEVDALGGAPGVYSARYSGEGATDASNRVKLLEALRGVPKEKRAARFVCVICLSSPAGETLSVRASCEGRILDEARGQGGFGYDPLFWVEGYGQTMAELSAEEKHRVSHRGKALRMLRAKLGG
ncbi:MAG: XTP/dITP diphosphatase [Myxococcota bacterium]